MPKNKHVMQLAVDRFNLRRQAHLSDWAELTDAEREKRLDDLEAYADTIFGSLDKRSEENLDLEIRVRGANPELIVSDFFEDYWRHFEEHREATFEELEEEAVAAVVAAFEYYALQRSPQLEESKRLKEWRRFAKQEFLEMCYTEVPDPNTVKPVRSSSVVVPFPRPQRIP